MASNAQRTHYALYLNRFAQQKAMEAIDKLGMALPCSVVEVSGSIVTVNFEVNAAPFTLPKVTVPIATSIYRREPTQIGDLGIVLPADVYIGAISGLGGGTPNLDLPASLSALIFQPVASANWDPPTDPNKYEIWGPDGFVIRTGDRSTSITGDASGTTILNNVVITGNLTVSGDTSFGGGAKKVVLDGDPVSGGAVHATSTTIVAT